MASFPAREEDFHPYSGGPEDGAAQMGFFAQSHHQQISDTLYVGYDEAGRGALAGPVSVAAVAFAPQVRVRVQQRQLFRRLDDSKNLAPSVRRRYMPFIKKYSQASSVVMKSAEEIDRLGINPATELAMYEAWLHVKAGLEKSLGPDFLKERQIIHLIDGNYTFTSAAWQSERRRGAILTSVIKGDSRLASIAAASILAKVTRDEFMIGHHPTYPNYGFGDNKGYAAPVHLKAIDQFGPCAIHRRSYEPVAGMLAPK